MSVHYETNCGQYVMHRDGKPVNRPLDEIAIAYEISSENGLITRHKHGEVERVRSWLADAKEKLTAQGDWGKSMADDLKIWIGKPDLNTLNEAIDGSQGALKNIVCEDLVIDVQTRVVEEPIKSSEPSASDVEDAAAEDAPPARGFRRFSRP